MTEEYLTPGERAERKKFVRLSNIDEERYAVLTAQVDAKGNFTSNRVSTAEQTSVTIPADTAFRFEFQQPVQRIDIYYKQPFGGSYEKFDGQGSVFLVVDGESEFNHQEILDKGIELIDNHFRMDANLESFWLATDFETDDVILSIVGWY